MTCGIRRHLWSFAALAAIQYAGVVILLRYYLTITCGTLAMILQLILVLAQRPSITLFPVAAVTRDAPLKEAMGSLKWRKNCDKPRINRSWTTRYRTREITSSWWSRQNNLISVFITPLFWHCCDYASFISVSVSLRLQKSSKIGWSGIGWDWSNWRRVYSVCLLTWCTCSLF